MSRQIELVWVMMLTVTVGLGGEGGGLAEKPPATYSYPGGYRQGGMAVRDLTIAQQRELGLSDEQIAKIAERRRDIENDRAAVEARLQKAREAIQAASAEAARIQAELQDLDTSRLDEVFLAVMTKDQVRAFDRKRFAALAAQWLQGYRQWLKLTEAQVEDITLLLVPVFEKYDKVEDEKAAARDRLAAVRKADPLDIAAIDQAEKKLAELMKENAYVARQSELMKALRGGLLPDQVEKLGPQGR